MENRVREFREGAGWSQGELARRLGVSRQTINAVETDKYDPSLPLALRTPLNPRSAPLVRVMLGEGAAGGGQ